MILPIKYCVVFFTEKKKTDSSKQWGTSRTLLGATSKSLVQSEPRDNKVFDLNVRKGSSLVYRSSASSKYFRT